MSRRESSVDRESIEFTDVALESLQESVRRALLDHQRRGFLVPVWSTDTVEWVTPSESLALYPAPRRKGRVGKAEQRA